LILKTLKIIVLPHFSKNTLRTFVSTINYLLFQSKIKKEKLIDNGNEQILTTN